MNVLIQIPFTIIMLIFICQLSSPIAFAASTLGFLSVIFTEAIFNKGITMISGLSTLQAIDDPFLRILYPLPEFAFLGILYVILKSKRINIFKLFKTRLSNMLSARFDINILGAMLLPVFLTAIGFYYQYHLERQLPAGMWHLNSSFLFSSVGLTVILSLLLAWKMIMMNGQEALMEMQQVHISNLQDMMKIIKAQRHDFINHLQTIYGLATLDDIDNLKEYIGELYHDIRLTGDILQIAVPQLSALLLVQSGWASAHNISLRFKIESDLAKLQVPALDLVSVVSNLMKNAIEAVDSMEPAHRIIELRILETPHYYAIQTQNSGCIAPDIKNNIFDLGYSTKSNDSERGIGLASVKYLVEKYEGKVMVNSCQDSGTKFTVCYPKHIRRERPA
ncbi:MAG: GHKL domain-containing protein [Syntrophomonadaceae bacterium]|nr:GHKL domain-containing protein [Syntrophomonadaceae bacterium]